MVLLSIVIDKSRGGLTVKIPSHLDILRDGSGPLDSYRRHGQHMEVFTGCVDSDPICIWFKERVGMLATKRLCEFFPYPTFS